ncbi:MAG: glycosyltransferase [Candidatus Hydrogenedentes bacterium]|nr:glycosyltransferase [Candidatus Hydrogenedentota bacterium]
MRLAVNATSFEPGYDEEDVFLRSLLEAMRAVQPETNFVLLTDEHSHDTYAGWERVYVGKPAPGSSAESGPHEKNMERAVQLAHPDLVLSPLQTALDIPAKVLVPIALDLGFLGTGGKLSQWRNLSMQREAKRICSQLNIVLAPSEYIRQQLLSTLGVAMNKVVVAHPGADSAYDGSYPSIAEEPFLMALSDTRHRELNGLLRTAFERLEPEMSHSLVVAGREDENEPADWGARVLRVLSCPPAYTAGLLQHSTAFICTSCHEGAALNVLRAMRAGARIIAPRVGGIAEIASTAAIYYNHENAGSLVSAIKRSLTEDRSERTGNIEYGKKRSTEFTWERCAWRTLNALKRVGA